jgi:two-component system nitrate/nitrite response regulator NarL
MPTIAIFAVESARRGALERVARAAGTLIDSAGDVAALRRLLERRAADIVLADGLAAEEFTTLAADYRATQFLVFADDAEASEFVLAGAAGILPSNAGIEIAQAAIVLLGQGLRLIPGDVLDRLRILAGAETPAAEYDAPDLTPREREVLAAMADGASNKMIARRLGISFHTAKFHVASILGKLDAETRTEALARAARLGLVML